MNWKQRLRQLKLADIKKNFPAYYKDAGGKDIILKPWKDSTTNDLTKCIIDFLRLSGHYANRINTQGQARIRKMPKFNIFSARIEHLEKVEYTKSTTRRGTPDIDAIINGMAVKIEVKAGIDRIRDEQVLERHKIELSGGLYFVARDMQSFVDWYDENLSRQSAVAIVKNNKIQF